MFSLVLLTLNRLSTARKTISLFLAFILTAGTIFTLSPSYMIPGAQAFLMDNKYEQDYGYPSDPGMDDKSHSKQSQKANCDNKNVNFNDIKQKQSQRQAIDNTLGGSADDGITGQELTSEEALDAITGTGDPLVNIDRNILNVCFNGNDNTLTGLFSANQGQTGTPVTPPPPPPPPPIDTTETLTVIKNTRCEADTQTCQQNPIEPLDFTILIEGNNPSQTSFAGSSTGTDVELQAGPYSVSEQGLDPVTPAVCTNMGFEAGRVATELGEDLFICTNFSVECEGDITIGNPQTCTIENVLVSTPTETLTVIKNVDCQADTQTCQQNPIQPSDFTIVIEGNDPSQNNFPGSSAGTNVELEAGPYSVSEQGLDPVTPAVCTNMGFEAGSTFGDDLFICTNFSDGCEGDITIGNPQTCTIDNVLVSTPTETLTVIKNYDCQADTQTCLQDTIQPSDFTIVIEGNDPSQNNFPGSSTGTDVELEAGPYSVSEEGLDPVTPQVCTNMGFEAGSLVSSGIGGNLFICTNFSDGCEGDMTIGTPQTCTIDNVLIEQNFLDIVTANFNTNTVSILLGTGTGTFGPPSNFPTGGTQPWFVAVADFNGDSNLDLAVANRITSNVAILLGTGTGTFGPPSNFPTGGIGPESVAVADFNGDGDLDLAVANRNTNNISILLGTGTGTFGPPSNFPTGGISPVSIAVGDFNNNGNLDLAVLNINSNTVSILLGTGTGTFGPPTIFPSGGTVSRSVAVGDFNSDTILDLAIGNQGTNNVSILLGTGTGTFGPPTSFPSGGIASGGPLYVAVGDFNNDGELDLALSNATPTVSILLGTGTGTFGPTNNIAVAGGPISVAVGDFNNLQ